VSDDAARERRSAEINDKARRAFLERAAEEWARANGRPPTEEDLLQGFRLTASQSERAMLRQALAVVRSP